MIFRNLGVYGRTKKVTSIELPLTISGCILWLDPTDLDTITKDGSDFVSAWDDKSSAGNDFVQVTGSAQMKWITNGLGTNSTAHLLGDGTSDYMTTAGISTDSDFTIIQVQQKRTTGVYCWAITSATGKSFGYSDFSDGTVWLRNRSGFTASVGNGDDTNALIGSVTMAGTSHQAYKNATALSLLGITSSVQTEDFINFGFSTGYSYTDGKHGDVLIYNRVLDSDERTTIWDFLNSKYGLY